MRSLPYGGLNGNFPQQRETDLKVFEMRATAAISTRPTAAARHRFKMMKLMVSHKEPALVIAAYTTTPMTPAVVKRMNRTTYPSCSPCRPAAEDSSAAGGLRRCRVGVRGLGDGLS